MGVDEVIEEAKEAAREWRALRQMPAPKPVGADALPVHLIETHAAFERRWLDNDVEPVDAGADLVEPGRPDPWSIEVDVPSDGQESATRIPLPETRGVAVCFVCEGARAFPCDDCEGTGQKRVEEHEPLTGFRRVYYVPCGTCGAAGTLRCDTCRGSAKVAVTRCLVVETGTKTDHELEHGARLSAELVAEILGSGSATPLAPRRLLEVERLDAIPAGALPAPVDAMVRGGLARGDEPDRRTRGRRVEVTAGWVVELKLSDRVLHVWGSPPRVAGDDAPIDRGQRVVVWAGIAVASIAAAVLLLLVLRDL